MAFVIGKNIQPLIFYKDTDICGVDDRVKIQKVDDRTLESISKQFTKEITSLSDASNKSTGLKDKTLTRTPISMSRIPRMYKSIKNKSERIITATMSEACFDASLSWYKRRY